MIILDISIATMLASICRHDSAAKGVTSVIRTQIQLTEAQVQALKLLAGKERLSMAEIIRVSIDRFLRQEAQTANEAQIVMAREAAGKYGCGLADLAENHDQYFAGKEK